MKIPAARQDLLQILFGFDAAQHTPHPNVLIDGMLELVSAEKAVVHFIVMFAQNGELRRQIDEMPGDDVDDLAFTLKLSFNPKKARAQ